MNFNKAISKIAKKTFEIANHPVFKVLKKARKRYIGIVVNSTVIYLLIYLIVLLIYQTATAIASITSNIHFIYFYNRIFFLTSGKSTIWSRDYILTVFSAAPAVSIYLCVICVMVFLKVYRNQSRYKLFFVWCYTLLLNRIISVFVIGIVFTLWGSNLIVDWLYLNRSTKIIFCAFSIILLLFVGKVSAKAFLYTADTPILILSVDKRLAFLLTQVLIPAIIGNIVLFLLLLPYISFLEVSVALSSVIMIIPVFFNYKKFKVTEAITMLGNDIRDEQYNIDKMNLLILIIFYITYRLIFIKGIVI